MILMKKIYKITRKTIALIHKNSNYYQTRIIERDLTKRSIFSMEQILDKSCISYGAGIIGRREAAKNILQTNINLPVSVGPTEGVYMFPTASRTNKNCVYLSYYHIKYYEQRDHKLYVGFHNGTGLYIKVSLHTFDIQIKKTAQLIAANQRKRIWVE